MCEKDCMLMLDENGEFTDHICTPYIPPEEWRDVPKYEGLYAVSNHGDVYGFPRTVRTRGNGTRVLPGGMKKQYDNRGYPTVTLKRDGKPGDVKWVHGLVTGAFLGTRPSGMDTCHNDGLGDHNGLWNLRYDERQANVDDMKKHGTMLVGEAAGAAKYTETQVLRVRELRQTHSLSQLSKVTGIARSTVNAMCNGTNWKYLK